LKIVDIKTQTFRYRTKVVPDSEGHAHPGDERDATQTMLTVVTDEGAEGYAFGPDSPLIESVVKPIVVGEDAFYRERVWQTLKTRQRLHATLTDQVLSAVDLALWDLAGRYLGQPVYKLLGGYRDKVPAYGSTMCGDEMPGGLSTPEEYGRFAEWMIERGYKAIKLHTWMPPIPPTADPKLDVRACAAVREAVGPDVPLMLDSYHFYSRAEALYIGKELEKLNYHWFEEMMDEHSVSSYVWLSEQLDIPVLGPEAVEGKMFARAEWIVRGASDITRGGVGDLGGITPLMKVVHLAESHGMAMEMHGPGAANLQVLGAMGIPGEFYERGLLHPFLDYEEPRPWLNALEDPMDDEGYVHLTDSPGLGQDINFDYIRDNLVDSSQ
jgi:L-alanine-DL-glutamate epimerase-like enolase superfamily enzyme